jgi:hypothetical protein
MSEIDTSQLDYYIEIRGVYDGWSVAKMKDGSYINRWEPEDRRYQATQDFIEAMKARQ